MPCIRNSNSSSYTKDQCWKWLSCQCALYVCDLLFARKSSGISYAYVQMDGSSHRKFMALYRRYVKQVIDRKWVPFFQLFSKYVFFRLPLSFYQFWVVPGLDDHVNWGNDVSSHAVIAKMLELPWMRSKSLNRHLSASLRPPHNRDKQTDETLAICFILRFILNKLGIVWWTHRLMYLHLTFVEGASAQRTTLWHANLQVMKLSV